RPVAALGLEEDNGVWAFDRPPEQRISVPGCGRGDDSQAGSMRVVGLGGVAVVLHAPDAAAVGNPDHDGQRDAAPGPVAQLRQMAGDLFESWIGERVELHL